MLNIYRSEHTICVIVIQHFLISLCHRIFKLEMWSLCMYKYHLTRILYIYIYRDIMSTCTDHFYEMSIYIVLCGLHFTNEWNPFTNLQNDIVRSIKNLMTYKKNKIHHWFWLWKSRAITIGIRAPGLDPKDHWYWCCYDIFQDGAHPTRHTNWATLPRKEERGLKCTWLARRRSLKWYHFSCSGEITWNLVGRRHGSEGNRMPNRTEEVPPAGVGQQKRLEAQPMIVPMGMPPQYVDPYLLVQIVKAVMEGMDGFTKKATPTTHIPQVAPRSVMTTNNMVLLVWVVKSTREMGCELYLGE